MSSRSMNDNAPDKSNTTMHPQVLLLYLVVISILIYVFIFRGWGPLAPSPTPTNTVINKTETFTPTAEEIAPSGTPLVNITETSLPTSSATSEKITQYQYYAGYTNDKAIPLLLLHESGELLGLSLTDNHVSKVAWRAPDGTSAVVYTDVHGIPKKAIVGNYIILYTNYTSVTVDLTIISQDGKRELMRVEHQIEKFNSLKSQVFPRYSFVDFKFKPSNQIDGLDLIKEGIFAFGIASCVGAAAGISTLAPPVLGVLAGACLGPLLTNEIMLREVGGEDVGNLEQYSFVADVYGCFDYKKFTGKVDCLSGAIAFAEGLFDFADNFKVPDLLIPPTKTKPRYP